MMAIPAAAIGRAVVPSVWPPFAVFVADARLGSIPVAHGAPVLVRPDDALEPRHLLLWEAERIWWSLLEIACAALESEKQTPAPTPDPAALDLSGLRAAMGQAPDPLRGHLERTIAAVDRLTAVRHHIKRPAWPKTAARMRECRCSLAWWALEEYRRGVAAAVAEWTAETGESPAFEVPTSTPALVRRLERQGTLRLDSESFVNALLAPNALEQRIRRASAKLRTGQAPHVMAWCLHDVTTYGERRPTPIVVPVPEGL